MKKLISAFWMVMMRILSKCFNNVSKTLLRPHAKSKMKSKMQNKSQNRLLKKEEMKKLENH